MRGEPPQAEGTLLVVEDDPDTAETLGNLLTIKGYSVLIASDGLEAMQLLGIAGPEEEADPMPIDLVLLDVLMQGPDGYEVCRRLREHTRDDYVPVIMVTALDSEAHRVMGLDSGADDYIVKPFTAPELLARIRSALRIRQLENRHRQVENALRQSEQRFADVARATGDCIWELDAEGRYTYVSPVMQEVLGYDPEAILGERYDEFYVRHEREELKDEFGRALSAGGPVSSVRAEMVHRDGHTVVVETTGLPILDTENKLQGCRGTHRDVTSERRLEETLAAVEVLGRGLVLSTDEQYIGQVTLEAASLLLDCRLSGLWVVDREQGLLVHQSARPAAAAADSPSLPLDGKQCITVKVALTGEAYYAPDVRADPLYLDSGFDTVSQLCAPLLAGEEVIGVLNVESQRPDTYDSADRRLLATLADQAALAIQNARLYKQMSAGRERLAALSRRLVEVQERERRRVARELHDEIGQLLTGLRLVLGMSKPSPAGMVDERIAEAQNMVSELLERVRELSLDLRPAMLDDLGLLPTLLWHFERYTARTGVRVAFKHAGVEGLRFPSAIETAAYRIVQEALTNVARHAAVSEVAVRIWADDITLSLRIEDRGVGFDVVAASTTATTGGLSGMEERAVLAGGSLELESAAGQGTRIEVELPLTTDGPSEGES
jgi:PAS domain S-box-containing protein